MVHEGGFQTGALADINACEGNLAGSAIASIVSQLDDAVDVVVSAHTHAAYNCKLPNAKGRALAYPERVENTPPHVSERIARYGIHPLPAREIGRAHV